MNKYVAFYIHVKSFFKEAGWPHLLQNSPLLAYAPVNFRVQKIGYYLEIYKLVTLTVLIFDKVTVQVRS